MKVKGMQDELIKLRNQNQDLRNVLSNIVADWDVKMRGDIEQYKESALGGYWSPAQAMIASEFIAAARKVLK